MREAEPSSDHFSEPASTNVALQKALQGHDDLLDSIPIIPAILQSLLGELNQPAEKVTMLSVADLVGRDESLAAQSCAWRIRRYLVAELQRLPCEAQCGPWA